MSAAACWAGYVLVAQSSLGCPANSLPVIAPLHHFLRRAQDLLRPESENLQIRENEGGVFVGGVHQQEVQNITQCLHLLSLGDRNRTTAFTALNAHSSRSHAVVMLTVIKRRSVSGTGEAEIQRVKVRVCRCARLCARLRHSCGPPQALAACAAANLRLWQACIVLCCIKQHLPPAGSGKPWLAPFTYQTPSTTTHTPLPAVFVHASHPVQVGKLFLVDLAGSERLKKSKSTGLRANEAKSINLSLTTLGMCINARADPNAAHVPFRDSKLTQLLQDSLSGQAKTMMFMHVAPEVSMQVIWLVARIC